VAGAARAKMPRTDGLGRRGDSLLRTSRGSPWEKHEKAYKLKLGGPVIVAVQKASLGSARPCGRISTAGETTLLYESNEFYINTDCCRSKGFHD